MEGPGRVTHFASLMWEAEARSRDLSRCLVIVRWKGPESVLRAVPKALERAPSRRAGLPASVATSARSRHASSIAIVGDDRELCLGLK